MWAVISDLRDLFVAWLVHTPHRRQGEKNTHFSSTRTFCFAWSRNKPKILYDFWRKFSWGSIILLHPQIIYNDPSKENFL